MDENSTGEESLEEQLAYIKRRVDLAYQNRIKITYNPDSNNTDENVEKSKQNAAVLRGYDDEDIVLVREQDDEPHEVIISDPHMYKLLLECAFNKLTDEGYMSRERIKDSVQDTLEHEFGHHVPALGQPGLTTEYGVSFVEDEEKQFRGLRPFIRMSGQLQIGVYKDIVGNVRDQSATDKATLDNLGNGN